MSVIYLDNNATTSVAPEVFESMIPFFTEKYGNASSMHTFGGQVGKSIQDAREKVAAMLGAQPEEIVFTSCGTESDSTAVMSALQAQPEKSMSSRPVLSIRRLSPSGSIWSRRGMS